MSRDSGLIFWYNFLAGAVRSGLSPARSP